MNGKPWTAQEVEALHNLYPHHTADVVGRVIGRQAGSVHAKANQLGIHKTEAFKASVNSGRVQRGQQDPRVIATRFKPGQAPWNKGKSYQAGGRSVETRFQPGRKPEEARNYLVVGSLRISVKDGYLERKVTDDPALAPARRWVAVHRLVWEAAHGPIPRSHVVAFRHGQRTAVLEDITLDRLECISRAELIRRNHPKNKSPELARLVQLKGAITRQVNRITKEAQERAST